MKNLESGIWNLELFGRRRWAALSLPLVLRGSGRGWGVVALSFFAVLFLALPQPALAQQTCVRQYPSREACIQRVQCQVERNERYFITNPKCACNGDCQFEDFVGLAVEASRFIFGITGSLALIMFAVGGFWWLTAGGVADRIEKGKKTLVAAVIGIIIIFGAWVIVNSLLAAITGQLGAGPVKILGGDWWKTAR
ncbi:hypothetical protein HY634_02065 [Candidatus Uhrbacteria bacterium]|nr:hypothetical protein [Candidatus Uhrbacteria bacterium]